ncbi:MAG: bifunctional diguanylate cyclase/phosphodiesterase [Aquimonas sp.]|nr:bifunctional diguanylate cyclase/phosphodiesterase [Aquimonas sp.]
MDQITVYLTQASGGLLVFLVLWAFRRRYGRAYLSLWALSFGALAAYAALQALAVWVRSRYGLGGGSWQMAGLAWLYGSAGLLQILALLAGVWCLARNRDRFPISGLALTAIAVASGLLLALIFVTEPDGHLPRLFLRSGTRYLLGGLALLVAAVLVLRRQGWRHFGRLVSGLALGLYSIELLGLGLLGLPLLWGQMPALLPPAVRLHGLFEVVMYPVLALGLVIWLMSDEQARLRQAESRLEAMGRTDAVTGLANADGLAEEVRGRQQEGLLAILGLDQFRLVNESRGMRAGDEVLGRVALHLRRALPEAWGLARLGGDQFAIVMPPGQASEAALERARAALAGAVGGHSGLLRASLGWARLSAPESLRTALGEASAALRQAKTEGGGRSLGHTASLQDSGTDWVLMAEEVEQAFESDAFSLYLQPIHRCRGEVVGFEALVRWQHPRHGLLAPGRFLPALQTLRQSQRLDVWVIQRAAQLLASMPGHPHWIAVNLGVETLLAPGTVDYLLAQVSRHGLPPSRLHLEVTEETALRSLEAGISVLSRLRAEGFSIAIDDFGTGYSSLSYLVQLPADSIKFDRQFLQDAADTPRARRLLTALVPLVRGLGLRAVAEGVETHQQSLLVGELGFDEEQGYIHGRPAPAEQVLALLAAKPSLRLVSAAPPGENPAAG